MIVVLTFACISYLKTYFIYFKRYFKNLLKRLLVLSYQISRLGKKNLDNSPSTKSYARVNADSLIFMLVFAPYLKILGKVSSALKKKIKQRAWSAVGISWEKNTDQLFLLLSPNFMIWSWILLKFNLFILVLFTIAKSKFDHIVSCLTNSNDYLITWRKI